MKRNQPERAIQLSIIKYLKMKGYTVGKIKTTGAKCGKHFIKDPYNFKGIADLMVFTPLLRFIEVKAGKNVLSSDQKTFQKLCKTAGIPYIVAYSLDDVIEQFP